MPAGFEPFNVERVDGGFVHTRMLKLSNDGGELQVLDEEGADLETLTEGIGPHPLFNGIARVTTAGLSKPDISTNGGQVRISAPGFTVTFAHASVQVSGTEVFVSMESVP